MPLTNIQFNITGRRPSFKEWAFITNEAMTLVTNTAGTTEHFAGLLIVELFAQPRLGPVQADDPGRFELLLGTMRWSTGDQPDELQDIMSISLWAEADDVLTSDLITDGGSHTAPLRDADLRPV